MTAWYSASQAVALLREQYWIHTTRRELLRRLVLAGVARRTPQGYQLMQPEAFRGLLRSRASIKVCRLESGEPIYRHTSSIQISPAGLQWLADTINLEAHHGDAKSRRRA